MEANISMSDHLKRKPVKVSGHLEEKRGIYQMMLSWTNHYGERSRKSISTGLKVKGNKKRAEDMLRDARKAQEKIIESTTDSDTILFADFMKQWLDVIRPNVKLTTFGGYQNNVNHIIAPYFREKDILLQDVSSDDINSFYAAQLKDVKASTIHKYHTNITKALKYAMDKGLIQHSPLDKVKRPKAECYTGKFLKQSEVVKLFEAVKGHKLELGVTLGAFYGLRRGEILGLQWNAIDFEANTISIYHTVTPACVDGKRIVIAADTTKTKSSRRTLPLVPSFRAKLLSIQAEQARNKKLCGKSYNKAEGKYIYTDQLGNRITAQYLSVEFPKFLEKHDFQKIRFHDLRHSCASLLLANGVSIKQIQEWLGHSNYAITANVYAHLDFYSKRDTTNAMKWIDQTSLGQVGASAQA
jgi:integrase